MFKKFAKVSTSLLSVFMILSLSAPVYAATDVHDVKTDINVKVEKDKIVEPPETPGGGGENPDPEIKGELGFWLKPSAINLEGKYSATEKYVLNQTDSSKERRIVVADVRDKETDWKVSAQLSALSGSNGIISDGYELTADATLGKFNVVNGAVNQTLVADANGVKLVEAGKITVNPDASSRLFYAKSDASNKRAGKGYSVTDLKNFKLTFQSGKGLVGDDFTGTINWKLSTTAE